MSSKQYAGLLMVCAVMILIGSAGIKQALQWQIDGQQSMAGDTGELKPMYLLRDFQSKRSSSWNPTGKNKDSMTIPAGESKVLFEENGAGCINQFYWAYIEGDSLKRQELFRGLVLRAYWDGADVPSIESPLVDFFGVSNGKVRDINSLAFATNPGHNRKERSWGFSCFLPMPFANGGRIEVENQTGTDRPIWFHINYELYEDASELPDNAGRLHARWNREKTTEGVSHPNIPVKQSLQQRWDKPNLTGDDNYTILDIEGDGQFVGYFLTVVSKDDDRWLWWGEGDDMIFIDGEDFPPSIHGTGSEEIFGGGACPRVEYSGLYMGFHCVENWNTVPWFGTNGMYRFYINSPIRFRKSIRATIEHGHANNKNNDYSSVAFWYQQGVNPDLPTLPPYEEREYAKDFQEPIR
jgi:hypothetical protein